MIGSDVSRLLAATSQKDLDNLAVIYRTTGGRAWEPQAPRHPWLIRMIAAGFLRRCDMRCGFEAFKDSGVTWTDAGRLAVEPIASAIEARSDATGTGAAEGESAVAESETPNA